MNSFVSDVFEKIAAEAAAEAAAAAEARLLHYNKRFITTSQEIQTAVCLILSKLVKHTVSEGTKSVTEYTISK